MGKSGKLFKSLVAGVKVFKSPSAEERPAKEKTAPANKKEDKDYVKKRSKDKCFGSLGKSSSRNRDVAACASFPDAIEIKCVQIESEKLKDMSPMAEAFSTDLCTERKRANTQDREEWAASKIQAAFRCYLMHLKIGLVAIKMRFLYAIPRK